MEFFESSNSVSAPKTFLTPSFIGWLNFVLKIWQIDNKNYFKTTTQFKNLQIGQSIRINLF
jgi:hypothetical protein